MKPSYLLLGLSLLMGTGAYAQAQNEDIHLTLKAGGVDIKGEVMQKGREYSIECFGYEQETKANPVGRRTYQPLIIRKRIDKTSPLLTKALLRNENISAVFKFYRVNPNAAGTNRSNTQENYYTVTLSEARILSVRQVMPDTRENKGAPTTEEVQFSFNKINWTYTEGGVSVDDSDVQMTASAGGAMSGLRVRSGQ